mgnify:FL=1
MSLFNRGGYVLDFSTANFDVFTMRSVGRPLCEHYGQSKAKSLNSFVNEASEADSQKLLLDLFEYYEAHYPTEYDHTQDFSCSTRSNSEMRALYLKCKDISMREKSLQDPPDNSATYLKAVFNSEYISNQIGLLMEMRTKSPADAIGKSKDLIESCCKTILERQGEDWSSDDSVAQLAKHTAKVLAIDANEIDGSTEVGKLTKQVLGSLQGITSGVAEYRNKFGTGHGKEASFQELPIRHAKLIVGATITLVEYYWETYEWRKEQGYFK